MFNIYDLTTINDTENIKVVLYIMIPLLFIFLIGAVAMFIDDVKNTFKNN